MLFSSEKGRFSVGGSRDERESHSPRIFSERTKGVCNRMIPSRGLYVCALSAISSFLILSGMSGLAHAEKTYAIQIGAYKDSAYAANEVKRLSESGHNAFSRRVAKKDKEKWHRVYVERYGSREKAAKEGIRLRRLGVISDYCVILLGNEEAPGINSAHQKSNPSQRKSSTLKIAGHPSNPHSKAASKGHGPGIQKTDLTVAMKDIIFQSKEDGRETVLFHLSAYLWPPVLFDLREENPRLSITFKNTILQDKGLSKIPVNGNLVKSVQTHPLHDPNTMMVVLDLSPGRDYVVSQAFDRRENIFSIVLETRVATKENHQSPHDEEGGIISLVNSWRKAWESGRLDDYIDCYHRDFVKDGKDLNAWKIYKKRLNNRSRRISVRFSDLKVKVGSEDKAWAYFRQAYHSKTHNDDGQKVLAFRKENGSWKIFREEWSSKKSPLKKQGAF